MADYPAGTAGQASNGPTIPTGSIGGNPATAFGFDPAEVNNSTGASSGQITVNIRGKYSDQQRGVFPAWWTNTMSTTELGSALYKMTPRELKALQQKMWQAGYYGEDKIVNNVLPRYGTVTKDDLAAFQDFVDDAVNYSKEGTRTAEELLDDRIAANGGLFDSAKKGMSAYVAPEVIQTVDPATVEAAARSASQSVLGRDLDPGEIASIVGIVTSEDYQSQLTNANARQGAQMAGLQAEWDRQNPGVPDIDPMTLIEGGGPDSSAIRFGQSLAIAFGGTVTAGYLNPQANDTPFDEFSEGLGVKIKVDMNSEHGKTQAEALTSYLSANEGQGKLVSKHEVAPDGSLFVVFNDGVRKPPDDSFGTTDGGGAMAGAFLGAVKRDGGDAAYAWEGPSQSALTRRGAYGINDRVYTAYATRIGLDPNDKSGPAQDRVAAAYAQDLYGKFGDWEKVAKAWFSSAQYQSGPFQRPGKGDYDDETVNALAGETVARMSELQRGLSPTPLGQSLADGQSGGFSISGGGVTVVPGVDPSSRAQLLVEQQHAAEAQGVGTSRAYDVFSQMMRGGN